ncbi:MAG TPA: hypothetical protein DHC76_13620 [Rhodobacteraceae bacterium]|nr:hypothetical protein [Paracoccaceae bacterium]
MGRQRCLRWHRCLQHWRVKSIKQTLSIHRKPIKCGGSLFTKHTSDIRSTGFLICMQVKLRTIRPKMSGDSFNWCQSYMIFEPRVHI